MRTTAARRLAPLLVAGALLAAGYARYAPGVEHAQDLRAYLALAWEENRYSDIIFLYRRLPPGRPVPPGRPGEPPPTLPRRRPGIPGPDDLAYPVPTGGLSYLLGFEPTLRASFDPTYAALTASALAAVALLRRLPGANPWYLAASPALALYTGLNWDLAAVAATVAALVAFDRHRDRWGGVALAAAVWLKFFPLVFLTAILSERLRERRYRAALEIAAVAAFGSSLLNLPFALTSFDGWSTFFTFNRDRPADGNLRVLFRDLSMSTVNLLAARRDAPALVAAAEQGLQPAVRGLARPRGGAPDPEPRALGRPRRGRPRRLPRRLPDPVHDPPTRPLRPPRRRGHRRLAGAPPLRPGPARLRRDRAAPRRGRRDATDPTSRYRGLREWSHHRPEGGIGRGRSPAPSVEIVGRLRHG